MRYILSVILLFFVLAINAATRQWRLVVSPNNRFLQYTDGTPFFWLGDTGWLLPERLNREEAAGYLKRAADAGFNVVQVQTINGVPAINAYGQYSNVSTSNPWDFSTINREGVYGYWDHMDYIIRTAESYGIYIAMDCIWGGLVKAKLIDVEGAKAYGTFLAERYKDNPNIVWFIGGDIQGNIEHEVWDTLARTIKSIDRNHLMTYHPRGRCTSAKWWADAEWIDFHCYQSGHRAYGQRMGNKDYPIPDNTEEDCWMYVDSTWNYKPIKPVIDAEPSYEDIPIGLHFPSGPRWQPHDVRRYAYWDVFAGTCGHTYGHNAIMQMAKPGYNVAYSDTSKPYYEAQHDPGYQQMKYLKSLMLSLPFTERVPDQSIIACKNGERYERLIATRGTDYMLIYNYCSRDMEVDLTKISGKQKNIWWMDAATGNLTFLATTAPHTGKYHFQPPRTEAITDGVLVVIDATKHYINKSQQNILSPVETIKDKEKLQE